MPSAKEDKEELLVLAEQVQCEARRIAEFCATLGTASPSLCQDWLQDLPKNIQTSRMRLREAARALHDISVGPFDHLFSLAWRFHDVSNLRWLIHFKIPQAIPLHERISYSELAATCGVNLSHLRRVLRFMMLKRLFHEPEPEHVAHTVYSSYMVTQKVLLGQLEFLTEDSFHFSTKVVEAHKKWPEASEPNQAPFNIDRNTELPRYVYLAQPENGVEMARFHNMLEFARLERATDVKFVPLAYKWQDVDTLVDIGGGTGHVAVTLAKAFPQLNIIVEDQAKSIAEAKSTLPVELQDRVRLVESDFFRPRHVEDAAVCKTKTFFLRLILHNWSDTNAKRVIEPLLPSIRAGAKLLIMDMMVPPPGTVQEAMELWMRGLDMEMMIQFNSRVRSQEDWQNLLAGTSQGLIIKSTNTPDGSGLTVMDVNYEN